MKSKTEILVEIEVCRQNWKEAWESGDCTKAKYAMSYYDSLVDQLDEIYRQEKDEKH